jgi:hypothetical protein
VPKGQLVPRIHSPCRRWYPDGMPRPDALTDKPPPGWSVPIIWSTLGLVAWLAFELTAQPAVATALFCSRFGWDDFLTAVWLRRTDPHRARASACSWYCLALGTTRILVTAFALTMLVIGIEDSLGKLKQNPNANHDMHDTFYGLCFLMFVGMPILALFAILGSVAAQRGRTQVWIDASLRRARRENVWPPEYSSGRVSPLQNRARLAWLAMLLIAGVAALGISAIVGNAVGPLTAVTVFVAGLAMFPLVAEGVIAQHPADCWGLPDPGT